MPGNSLTSITSFNLTRLLLKLLLLSLAVVAIGAFNLMIDPAHLFNSEKFTEQASIDLSNGYHLANFNNADERLFQKKLIAKLKYTPEIIVLGSSTSMQIGQSYFNKHRFFNSAVSSSTLEDYLAVYRLYEKNNKEPKVVMIGINPWIFDHDITNDRIGIIAEEYQEMLAQLAVKNNLEIPNALNNSLEKVKTVFSGEYFFESFQAFRTSSYYATKDSTVQCPIKHNDGTVNEFKYWNRDTNYVNSLARNYTNEFEDYASLSATKCNLLEAFVTYLQSKNKKVIFYISPLHPYTYPLKHVNKTVTMINTYYQAVSKKLNVLMIGNINPAMYHLQPQDFYDAQHLKKPASDKIFALELNRINQYIK